MNDERHYALSVMQFDTNKTQMPVTTASHVGLALLGQCRIQKKKLPTARTLPSIYGAVLVVVGPIVVGPNFLLSQQLCQLQNYINFGD